jgi:hypothetical protein
MTSTEHYRKIIHGFCEIAGLDDPIRLIEDGQLHVNGFDMLLFYDEQFDPERLQIRIDFRNPPALEKRLADMLAALLMNNYIGGMGGLFVFGLNPEDGHVVLTVQVNIDADTTGQDLMSALRDTTARAKTIWQSICAEFA